MLLCSFYILLFCLLPFLANKVVLLYLWALRQCSATTLPVIQWWVYSCESSYCRYGHAIEVYAFKTRRALNAYCVYSSVLHAIVTGALFAANYMKHWFCWIDHTRCLVTQRNVTTVRACAMNEAIQSRATIPRSTKRGASVAVLYMQLTRLNRCHKHRHDSSLASSSASE